MNRQDFINYIEACGCVLVRNTNQGYGIYRSVLSAKMSGVPIDDPLYPATVCRICKTLGIDSPEEARVAQQVIDDAHRRHGRDL